MRFLERASIAGETNWDRTLVGTGFRMGTLITGEVVIGKTDDPRGPVLVGEPDELTAFAETALALLESSK